MNGSESVVKADYDSAKCDDQQIVFAGRECVRIPTWLGQSNRDRIKRMDLSFNCLLTLSGVQNFPNLEELIIDNNNLIDLATLPFHATIHTLSLNKNRILDLDYLLDVLSTRLPALTYLSMLGNPACPDQLTFQSEIDEMDYQRYRYHVLYRLPKLRFLDSRIVTNCEFKESQRIGVFTRVVRPNANQDSHLGATIANRTALSRLNHRTDRMYGPLQATHSEGPIGIFGRCKYKYSGKHSEGNRFIRNKDL